MKTMTSLVPQENIKKRIYVIRGANVILDVDLAELYDVSTKVFNQAVKRNMRRFPGELFMFQLSEEEFKNLRSQIVTSRWGGRRYLPYAFTEHGVAMLSNVLNSDRAIEVSIQIVIAFINLRRAALEHKEVWKKIEEMEKRYDSSFKVVFDTLKSILLAGPEKLKKKIGFKR